MTAGGDLSGSGFGDHTSVKFGEWREFVRGHSIVDKAFDRVGMRRREVVREEFFGSDDSLPGADIVQNESGLSRLVWFSILVYDSLRGFAGFLQPATDYRSSLSRFHSRCRSHFSNYLLAGR
jgi:hypothetical protein